MSSRELRDRLRRATAEARSRHLEARAAIERREDPAPRPGDVFVFSGDGPPVTWVAVDRIEPDGLLLVAADLQPMVGSTDVEVAAGAACGAMVLRCGFEVRCGLSRIEAARRTGCLEPKDLERARGKRAQIELGAVTSSRDEQETDTDPVYRDWLEEGPAAARAALLESLGPEDGETADELLWVDGVDGLSGGYRTPALHPSEMARWAREERIEPALLRLLQHVHQVSSQPHLGLPAAADPGDLGTAGWALVVASGEPPAVREALAPLLDHRRRSAGDKAHILEYRPGESWRSWLSRHGVGPGQARPSRVPHYLLLAGDPAAIPWELQGALGVEYAVGRLSFDTPEEYRRYAEGVLRHEAASEAPEDRSAVFFAPRLDFDPITRRTANLVESLAGLAAGHGLHVRRLAGAGATKAELIRTLERPAGSSPPALFVAASHGIVWPSAGHEQRLAQGALVCQGWPAVGRIDVGRHCLTGADVAQARVGGMLALLYASYSAGTPDAETPFVGDLPRRLLGHSGGGAASVIGLLGRAWSSAAGSPGQPPEPEIHELTSALLSGVPAGHAVHELKKRYATLSTRLQEMRQKLRHGAVLDDREVAAVWRARNAARDVIVLGDPAVRLRTG